MAERGFEETRPAYRVAAQAPEGAFSHATNRASGRDGNRVRALALCGMMAALLAVLSFLTIPLPFSPVPLSLQTLAVLLAGGLLGRLWGPVAVAVYLALGLAGLPVFAGGAGGIGELLGPRGGYLVGFVLAAFIMGVAADAARAVVKPAAAGEPHVVVKPAAAGEPGAAGRPSADGRRNVRPYLLLAAGAGLATLSVYAVGVSWLAAVTHMGLARGAAVGALPFIPGDVLKAAVAVPLIWTVDRAVTRAAPR